MPKGSRGGKGAVRPSADGVITATKKTKFISRAIYYGLYDDEDIDGTEVWEAVSDGKGTLYFHPAKPVSEKEYDYETSSGHHTGYEYSLQAGWVSRRLTPAPGVVRDSATSDYGELFGLDLTKAKKVVIQENSYKLRKAIEARMDRAGLVWSYEDKAFVSMRGYYYSYKQDKWLPSKYEQTYRNYT